MHYNNLIYRLFSAKHHLTTSRYLAGRKFDSEVCLERRRVYAISLKMQGDGHQDDVANHVATVQGVSR